MATEISEGFLFDLLTKRRAGKFTAEDMKFAADHAEIVRWVQAHLDMIEGLRNGQITVAKRDPFPSELLVADLIPDGWTVVEDVAPSTFDVSKLVPRSFLKKGESLVNGETMRKRAVELRGNLGLADGKRLFDEQDKIPIPVAFRDFYIPLPGTILRDSDGNLYVAGLDWGGGRWCLGFCWLGGDWGDDSRFACSE